MSASGDRLAAALTGHGYVRHASRSDFSEAPRKEWLHFVVQASGLDLLANFHRDEPAGDGTEVARYTVAVVARTADGVWHGDVEEVPAAQVRLSSGRLSLRYGTSSVRPHGRGLRLRAQGRSGVEADLTLEARTYPMFAPNVVVDGRPAMHWFVVPRMRASGRVRVGSVEIELRDACAYHDHNWGEFLWGGDFAWNWGFVTPAAEDEPWSLVLLRLTDRARLRDSMRSLVLWDGERQVRVFRGEDLQIETEGLLRARNLVKLPRALALLSPGEVTDVPQRFVARTARGRESVEVEVIARDTMQFVVPNDANLGSTLIHEVVATASVSGRVDGRAFAFERPCVFEFVGSCA
jgi:hypothetical protein